LHCGRPCRLPGERKNPIMGAQAATLSKDDIKALAT